MLRFLHEIEHLNDQQLRKKVQYKIQKLERKSKKYCPDDVELGYNVGYNPTFDNFEFEQESSTNGFFLNCIFGQFARPDNKMIYCLSWNSQNNIGNNNGNYYYMDDQEYLYDFCKFIQDKEVEDEYELFEYIRDFLHDYFGYFKQIDRECMNRLLLKQDGVFFEPVKEHSIRDFKGKGNAMCSEYAIMAHNLLKLFDFETYLVVGNVIFDDQPQMAHAYNLITFQEENSGEVKHAVLDFINAINVYDEQFNKIGDVPFMGFIDELDLDFINQFVSGNKHLTFDEYRYLLLGETIFKLGLEKRKRDYYIDNYLYANQDVNCSKIYTKEKKTGV